MGDVKAARLIVEVSDPQCLTGRILLGKAAREELPRRGESIELYGGFGTLIPHMTALPKVSRPNDTNLLGSGG